MNLPNINDERKDEFLDFSNGDYYYAFVPLNKIDYRLIHYWKIKRNTDYINKMNCVIPVKIGDDCLDVYDFPLRRDKYSLIDGNHRCICCKPMNYTHIPAIIPNYIEDDDFIIVIDKRWSSDEIEQKYSVHKRNNDLNSFWKNY